MKLNPPILLAIALVLSGAVRGGTPLICHPYAIGSAPSLPSGEGKGTDTNYDRSQLTADTLRLLTPETPVIVRMETLRRAAIYASGNLRHWQGLSYTSDDRKIAADLVQALRERTVAKVNPHKDLALFDLGFFAETLRQTSLNPALEGYPLLIKVAEMRPNDPDVQFALALASAYPERRPDYSTHLAKARAGSRSGTLLAQNLQSHFSTR